jgi:hypothetical protein
VNLAAKIADEDKWLAGIRAQGGTGLALDDRARNLERMRAELEALRAAERFQNAAACGGPDYARMCDEHEQWLKEKRAQGVNGQWLERAEQTAREERARHAGHAR